MIMFKMAEGRILVVCAFVFLYIADISSAAVSSTTCTSGGKECHTIINASCDTSKCKCDQGYKENTDTCAAIGIGDTCSAAPDCTSVAHTECKTKTCACLDGYTQISDACVRGLGDSCSVSSDCAGVTNAECATTCQCSNGYKSNVATCDKVYGMTCSDNDGCAGLDNSACVESNCACAQGYVESNNICALALGGKCTTASDCAATNAVCDGTLKVCACKGAYKVVGTNCVAKGLTDPCSLGSDCTNVTNAECTTETCQCSNGYKANGATCEKESGAVSMKSAVGLVFGSVVLLLIQAL